MLKATSDRHAKEPGGSPGQHSQQGRPEDTSLKGLSGSGVPEKGNGTEETFLLTHPKVLPYPSKNLED